MIRDIYKRSANSVAHLGAWGLEQVGRGLEAATKRLFDSKTHDGGSDDPSVEQSRDKPRTAQESQTRQRR